MKNLFLTLSMLSLFVACVPQQVTDFQEVDITDVDRSFDFDSKLPVAEPEVVITKCEDIKYEDICIEAPKCQILLDEFEDKFLSCIPIKKEEEPKEVVVKEEDKEEDKMVEVEAKDGICKEQKDDEKFVVICHIPPGNIENAHSICISKQGWLHGHKDRHGKEDSRDYLGACKDQDLESPEDD